MFKSLIDRLRSWVRSIATDAAEEVFCIKAVDLATANDIAEIKRDFPEEVSAMRKELAAMREELAAAETITAKNYGRALATLTQAQRRVCNFCNRLVWKFEIVEGTMLAKCEDCRVREQ